MCVALYKHFPELFARSETLEHGHALRDFLAECSEGPISAAEEVIEVLSKCIGDRSQGLDSLPCGFYKVCQVTCSDKFCWMFTPTGSRMEDFPDARDWGAHVDQKIPAQRGYYK